MHLICINQRRRFLVAPKAFLLDIVKTNFLPASSNKQTPPSTREMEGYALTVSPSTSLVRSSTSLLPSRHPNPRSALAFPSSTSALRSTDVAFLTSKVHSLSSASKHFWRYSLPPLVWRQRASSFMAKAASVPENEGESANPSDLVRIIQLAIMFIVWYLLNIYFNIYNKQVLKVYPFPATVTAFQFGCGTVLIFLMWGLKLHPTPKLTKSQLSVILTLGSIHTLGNLLTNISLGKVAVSFTHTIKAMEPFFTVLFAALFLGESPSIWVLASLMPIVGGVALASFTEASFNWIGFGSAMASNVTNQSRNVLSKKFMIKKEESLDNINLFSLITIFAFLFLFPIAILIEGVKFSPSYLQHAASGGVNTRELGIRLVLSGICFHSYQQVSYVILGMVSAVTHAVGNSVKRVVVIISSVIFFQTPVSPINSLGTAIALVGVFLYSKAKRMKPKAI